MTVVSGARLERLKVVPAGTEMLFRMSVAQADAEAEACAAPLGPVKVQLVARLRVGVWGKGAAAGAATMALAARDTRRRWADRTTMVSTLLFFFDDSLKSLCVLGSAWLLMLGICAASYKHTHGMSLSLSPPSAL